MILVVPIDPEYLPETMLVVAAVFTGVLAARRALHQQWVSAAKSFGIAIGCAALAILLARTMHGPARQNALVPADKGSMTLELGGVDLHIVPSDHIALSVEGKGFLDLERKANDLWVSCTVVAPDGSSAKVIENSVPVRGGVVNVERDAHALVVQGGGRELLRVGYPDPTRIVIQGDFYERGEKDSTKTSIHLITLRNGIEWPGGRVPFGRSIELTSQGTGRIDFGASGSVRVIR